MRDAFITLTEKMNIQELINSKDVTDWSTVEKIIKLIPKGLCCEFGISTGRYTRIIAEWLKPRKYYGFDSFEGLPEDWEDRAKKGDFKCEPPTDLGENVELIIGLFQDTLDEFLYDRLGQKIAFAHFDADLYSSTSYLLTTLGANSDFAEGAIIMFDQCTREDFNLKHEGRALQEFADYNWYKIDCIGRHKWDGAIFRLNSVNY